ncbi:MAG: hypothetical protein ACLF0G_00865 [Candidatus Brocadiia bacterium]
MHMGGTRLILAVAALVCSAATPGHGAERVAGPAPKVVAAELAVDLSVSVQEVTPRNLRLHLDLLGLLSNPKGGRNDLAASLSRLDGQWKPGEGKAPRYNRATHEVDGSGLRIDRRSLQGSLHIAVKPDRWVPKDKKERAVRCTVGARVYPLELGDAAAADEATDRFRKRYPAERTAVWGIEGTYQATYDGQPVEGKLTGYVAPAQRPGYWTLGQWRDGVRMSFDMGTERVNWNHARTSVLAFPEPRDLSAFHGIRLRVDAEAPRHDAAVTVWLREADGSWYHVRSAVPLADERNERVLLFEDFTEAEWVAPTNHMDEDYVLDTRSISHLAVGVINPLGVGRVAFTLEALEFVQCATAPWPPARAAVTGRTLAVNGHEIVPPGIFGTYPGEVPVAWRPGCRRALGGPQGPRQVEEGRSEAFLIDCWFDRFTPALILTDARWKEKLGQWATRYAQRARELGLRGHLEFWNEPYLNWARGKDARNYRVRYFDVDKARDGGPVTIEATGERFPLFRWKKTEKGWRVYDPTQFTYWSGRGNGELYNRMAEVVAHTVKAANPEVQMIAGWGFRWNEDHWAAWDLLYRPTIDRLAPNLDGVHEHHYQGDTTGMNGTYEVLVAYAKTRHGKWLYAYNTETGDLIDVPARGHVDTPEKARAARIYRKNTYNLRDMIYSVLQSPDKLRSRTVLVYGEDAPTEEKKPWRVAYTLLRNLRGRLLETRCDDPRLWCVASLDGTDPRAMPPDGATALVVVLFNDHRRPRDVELQITAPAGTTFRDGTVERTVLDRSSFDLRLVVEPVEAAGARKEFAVTLPGRSAWKVSLPLAGEPPSVAEVRRRQFFAPRILAEVSRGEEVATEVKLDRSVLRAARRAWLRLVVEGLAPGEGTVHVGDKALALPKAYTADNVTRIVELPVATEALAETVPLVFRVKEGNFAGYRVDMASIVLETAGTP